MENEKTGIVYFKRSGLPQSYIDAGDITKNSGLTGNEIDNNFFILRGKDIENVEIKEKDDKQKYLVFKRIDGSEIYINLDEFSENFNTKLNLLQADYIQRDTEIQNQISEMKDTEYLGKPNEIKVGKIDKNYNISFDDDAMFIAG